MKLFLTLAAMVLAVYSAPSGINNKFVGFGWLDDNVVLKESYQVEELKVGYVQGSGPELTLRLTLQNGTAKENLDYSVSPRLVTIGAGPAVVEVRALLDGLALEGDESFTIVLEPVNSPLPDGLFRDSLTVTLLDSDMDNLELSFTSDRYRALEGEGNLAVVVNKNKRLASPLSLTITPATVEQALLGWGDVSLPTIPVDMNTYQHLQSTNRASVKPSSLRDFDDHPILVQFSADEEQPVDDLTVTIPVLDDELNEATDEFFVVRFDAVESGKPVKVETQTALCQIVDNDSMRIGFAEPSYTVPREDPYSFLKHSIKILSENNRTSEQTFTFDILVLSSSPSPDIPPLEHDILDCCVFGHRKLLQFLDKFQSEFSLDIFFDLLTLPAHPVAFELVILSQEVPHLLPARELYQSTYIII